MEKVKDSRELETQDLQELRKKSDMFNQAKAVWGDAILSAERLKEQVLAVEEELKQEVSRLSKKYDAVSFNLKDGTIVNSPEYDKAAE